MGMKGNIRFSGTAALLLLLLAIGGLLAVVITDFNPFKSIDDDDIFGDSQYEYYDNPDWKEGPLPDSIGSINKERMRFIQENNKRLRQFYGYDSPEIE